MNEAKLLAAVSVPWLQDAPFFLYQGVAHEDNEATAGFAFVYKHQGNETLWLLVHVNSRGWDIPGGHLEAKDATPTLGVRRELFEETGIAGHDIVLDREGTGYCVNRGGNKYPMHSTMLFYSAEAWEDGEVTTPEEVDELAWVTAAQVRDLCSTKPWLALFNAICDSK